MSIPRIDEYDPTPDDGSDNSDRIDLRSSHDSATPGSFPMTGRFTIRRHVDLRLDVYLQRRLDGISRSRVQKLIDAAAVTVNGSRVKPSTAVRRGDVIDVRLPPQAIPNDRAGADPAGCDLRRRLVPRDQQASRADRPPGQESPIRDPGQRVGLPLPAATRSSRHTLGSHGAPAGSARAIGAKSKAINRRSTLAVPLPPGSPSTPPRTLPGNGFDRPLGGRGISGGRGRSRGLAGSVPRSFDQGSSTG